MNIMPFMIIPFLGLAVAGGIHSGVFDGNNWAARAQIETNSLRVSEGPSRAYSAVLKVNKAVGLYQSMNEGLLPSPGVPVSEVEHGLLPQLAIPVNDQNWNVVFYQVVGDAGEYVLCIAPRKEEMSTVDQTGIKRAFVELSKESISCADMPNSFGMVVAYPPSSTATVTTSTASENTTTTTVAATTTTTQ